MGEITIIPSGGEISTRRASISSENAIELWLSGYRSANTRAAYRREIEAFRTFLGDRPIGVFLGAEEHEAHILVDAYRAGMIERQLSPATVNRSMSALNSFVCSARRHGLTRLRIETKTQPAQKYRDTRGPGLAGVRKLLDAARDQRDPWQAARDVAIVRLLFALGLRRAELAACDLADFDESAGTLAIVGKGHVERIKLTVPPTALAALGAWVAERGTAPGPLFLTVDTKERFSGSSVYHLIRKLGARAQIVVKPHGIRHAAITAVLDASNGDQRRAQQFARHSSADTTVAYDDNRQDAQGSAARLIDALME